MTVSVLLQMRSWIFKLLYGLALYNKILMNKTDLQDKMFFVFSDLTLLSPLYNHLNKLATHHMDRHRNQLRAYNFDVQFVKGTIATKRDKGRYRVSQDLEKETVQSQIKRDKQGGMTPHSPVRQCGLFGDPP